MLFGGAFGLFVIGEAAAGAPAGLWPNGYRYRVRRILSGALHGLADGDGVWLFWLVQNDAIKSVANGGHVEDGAELDSRFETGTGQQIQAEAESYDPVAGTLTAWLHLTGVRGGIDVTVCHYYGKADLTVPQHDPTACWDGWSVVSRLSDGLDQTGHERHLTLDGVSPTTLLGAAAGDFG